MRLRRKPHGPRVKRGRTVDNELMDLGTTIVLSSVSSALSSVVEHCSGMDWLLHMSMLKLPWLYFAAKQFWRQITLLRAQIQHHNKREDGMDCIGSQA